MKLSKSLTLTLLLATALGSSNAQSIVIDYELIALGSNSYQYNYIVTNDDFAPGIEEFSIFFDLGLYDNLIVTNTPSGWDSIVLQPDPALPDDGLFDSLALGPPITLGMTVSGFSVAFDWLGTESPENQYFDIVDPSTFDVLYSGATNLNSVSVPEPSSLLLFIVGLISIFIKKTNFNNGGSYAVLS